MFRSLATGLALVVSACANVPFDYRMDPTKAVGLVVGTITYESSVGEYGLVARSASTDDIVVFRVGDSLWSPFTRMHDDDLGMRGGTFAVEVPAGEYRVLGWQVRRGYRTFRSDRPVDIAFVVETGKSTYLGNLHFSSDWDVSLHDRVARDLPILQRRFEAVSSSPLAIAIAKGTHIEKFGGGYISYTHVPIFIPIPVR